MASRGVSADAMPEPSHWHAVSREAFPYVYRAAGLTSTAGVKCVEKLTFRRPTAPTNVPDARSSTAHMQNQCEDRCAI